MVRTCLVDSKAYQQTNMEFPELLPEDVAEAVIAVLATPKHVVISELTIKPAGEMF